MPDRFSARLADRVGKPNNEASVRKDKMTHAYKLERVETVWGQIEKL